MSLRIDTIRVQTPGTKPALPQGDGYNRHLCVCLLSRPKYEKPCLMI
jgi:hypothetical protein